MDSLGLKFSDYGLNCDCHANPGEIKLSPNPFESIIYVQNNSGETIENIKIFNTLGQKIVDRKGSATEINIGHLAPAVYFYNVETESGKEYPGQLLKMGN